MDHAEARELLQDDLDGRLGPDARKGLHEHLGGCAECAAEAEELASLRRLLRAAPPAPAPAGFTEEVLARLPAGRVRVLPRLLAAAAAAAAVVVAAVLLFPRVEAPVEMAAGPEAGSRAAPAGPATERAAPGMPGRAAPDPYEDAAAEDSEREAPPTAAPTAARPTPTPSAPVTAPRRLGAARAYDAAAAPAPERHYLVFPDAASAAAFAERLDRAARRDGAVRKSAGRGSGPAPSARSEADSVELRDAPPMLTRELAELLPAEVEALLAAARRAGAEAWAPPVEPEPAAEAGGAAPSESREGGERARSAAQRDDDGAAAPRSVIFVLLVRPEGETR